MELAGVRHLEAHAVVHAGFAGVVPGDVHGAGVDVAAPDVVLPMELPVLRLVRRVHPRLGGQERPVLGVEPPVKAGGAVLGDERRLDRDGAAAAEGVAEGVASPVAAERHQRRRQRLPQGCLHAHGAVAPLVQSLAAGVQPDGHLILEHGEAHLILRPRLRELLDAVVRPQALHHGLFDDALAGGHGVQLAGDGVALHREGGVLRQEFLPRDGADALKQLLEAPRRELPQQGDDPRAAAQVDVQPGTVRPAAPAEDAAVLRPHVLQAQTLHLVGHQLFQPQQAGDLVCYHQKHLVSCVGAASHFILHSIPKNARRRNHKIQWIFLCKSGIMAM